MAGIGAAAHSEGGSVLAGHLVVGVDAGADGGAVGLDIERLGCIHVLQLCALAQRSGDLSGQLCTVGAGGEAAVDGLHQLAVLHIDAAADDGQRAKGAVGAIDAKAGACGGAVQLAQCLQIGALGVVAQAVVQQVIRHQTNGVHRALRHGSVAGLTPAAHPHAVPFRLQRDVGGVLQLADIGLDQRAGAVRHSVVGHTALKLCNNAVAHRADDLAAKVTLFAVAHRELRIRGKAEHRGGVICQIILHILHVGLLVVAHQCADGVAQLVALLLQELQRIQGNDHGALIVRNAAAQQPAVLNAHLEGVCRPAVAHGHNVHVADGGKIFFRICTGQLGIADVVFAVAGSKTHTCCQLQRLIQRGPGACAEGCALLRGALHAVDGHQRCNVLQQLLLIFRNICVNFLIQCLIHVL